MGMMRCLVVTLVGQTRYNERRRRSASQVCDLCDLRRPARGAAGALAAQIVAVCCFQALLRHMWDTAAANCGDWTVAGGSFVAPRRLSCGPTEQGW